MDDIVRFHMAAMGGEEKIVALDSIRAEGVVREAGHEMSFALVAQRPNRVRITTRGEGHSLVQGWNGTDSPWRWQPDDSPNAAPMAPSEARAFGADAEYDDPLIGGKARGFALDYAGEMSWRGRAALRVLVTRLGDPAYTLLVDHETYFIVARLLPRRLPTGQVTTVITRFSDFRPVSGVILPFHIEIMADEKLLQETVLSEIVALPNPPAATFATPGASVLLPRTP